MKGTSPRGPFRVFPSESQKMISFGSMWNRERSASYPGAIFPVCESSPRIRAGVSVAARTTSPKGIPRLRNLDMTRGRSHMAGP